MQVPRHLHVFAFEARPRARYNRSVNNARSRALCDGYPGARRQHRTQWGVIHMRRLFVGLVMCAVALIGVAAQAGTLGTAELSFAIGALPPATFPATGATGTATSNLDVGLGAGNAFNGTFSTTIPTSAAPPLTKISVKITKNDAGNFKGTAPAKVGGDAKFGGVSDVYGLGSKLLAVPLGFGAPGSVTQSAGGVAITVINAPWTVGVASVTGTDDGTAMLTGMNGLDAGGVGTVQLVAPVKIITNIAGTLAAFAVLDLTYVPEPALPLMLVAGAGTLAAVGARRRRR